MNTDVNERLQHYQRNYYALKRIEKLFVFAV